MTHQDRTSNARRSHADASIEQQLQADTDENRRQAERLESTPPPRIDEERVEEIARDAEQRAKPSL